MAGSVNKVILVGNLGSDPEIRHTQDGRPIANFSIATSDSWRDKNTGERREKTEWHRIVVFSEGLVKVIEQYVKKGSKVFNIVSKIDQAACTNCSSSFLEHIEGFIVEAIEAPKPDSTWQDISTLNRKTVTPFIWISTAIWGETCEPMEAVFDMIENGGPIIKYWMPIQTPTPPKDQ